MPSDILGSEILNENGKFEFINESFFFFLNSIQTDEISRTPLKMQAALLETMQDDSVELLIIPKPMPKKLRKK